MSSVEIRCVQKEELPQTIELFRTQIYFWSPDTADAHFADHITGGGDTLLAWLGQEMAGFLTIRWVSHNPVFRENNIPLIHHLEVVEAHRGKGIGWQLMEAGEALIATRANTAGITVGVFDTYGAAQRLYAKRGYLPDGRGVCKGHTPIRMGETHVIDHDLILWLTKDLS